MEKIALTPRSKELIKNYLLGGAALGGSGALLTSLMNYINTLKQQAAPDAEREDDDTLYINVNDKAANESAGYKDLAAGGLALTGGVLSTLGTYALVRKLYQQMKRKQLQEQLDLAQQEFVNTSDAEAAAKKAATGQPMGLAELAYSAPGAFALLSAIAAGALTHKALDKTFPRIKKPAGPGLKKVVVRRAPKKEDEGEEKNAYDKVAAEQQYSDGLEFLVHLCMGSKSASQSELVDIVHAVAQGRGAELQRNMLELGFDTAMETIKGASELDITPLQKQLAISYCVKSAALSPVVSMLAAAEYNDMAPKFTSISQLQSEECQDTLLKLAGTLGAMNRAEMADKLDLEFVEDKQANDASLEEILQAINQLYAQKDLPGGEGMDGEDVEQNDDLSGEDSIESGEEKQVDDRKPMTSNKIVPDVIDELGSEDDFIDEALSSPTTPAKAVAAEND